MAEPKDKEKEKEVEVKVKETEDKGIEERPTGRSEGEALANVVKFIQLADGYYR